MTQQIKWILALTTAGLFLAGAILASSAYVNLTAAEMRTAELEMEARNLRTGLSRAKQVKKDLERFNRIMSEAEGAGIKPDLWIEYPVDINRELSWNDASEIIGLASEGGPRTKHYWYGPKSFTFELIRDPKGKDDDEAPTDTPILVKLDGEFLMPKPGSGGAGGFYAPWFENLRQLKEYYGATTPQ